MTDYLGIIDRGVGGLGFYSKLREQSGRPVLYFADSGHAPYGKVSKNTLRKRLQKIIDFLHEEGASRVVIACNSASAAYADTDLVKGIISFGISSVLNRLKTTTDINKLTLIAGRSTVQSGIYRRLFAQHGVAIKQRIAQQLSINIENGLMSGDQFDHDLEKILAPIRHYDLMLHACTHYPAANLAISKIMKPGCLIVDPVDDLVSWVNKNWPADKNKNETQFFCSGDLDIFKSSSEKSFQIRPENLQHIAIDCL